MDLKKQLSLKDLDDAFYMIQCAMATSECNPVGNLHSYVISDVPNSNGLYENLVKVTKLFKEIAHFCALGSRLGRFTGQ